MYAAPRLLVAGAETSHRIVWAAALRAANFDVVEVEVEADVVRLMKGWQPVGVVLHWPLGETNGEGELLRFLRDYNQSLLIMVMAASPDVPLLRGVLDAGADLCLPATYDEALLVAQVESVLDRRSVVPNSKLRCGDLVVDTLGHRAWRGEGELMLTSVEFRLLVALAAHCDQLVTKPMLLKEVWRRHDDARLGGGHLVEVHIASLRKKLHEFGAPMIHTVRGQGFILRASSL